MRQAEPETFHTGKQFLTFTNSITFALTVDIYISFTATCYDVFIMYVYLMNAVSFD